MVGGSVLSRISPNPSTGSNKIKINNQQKFQFNIDESSNAFLGHRGMDLLRKPIDQSQPSSSTHTDSNRSGPQVITPSTPIQKIQESNKLKAPSPRPEDVVNIIDELRDEEKRYKGFRNVNLDYQAVVIEKLRAEEKYVELRFGPLQYNFYDEGGVYKYHHLN